MRKNTSGQVIGAQMISASDGSAFTGSVTVYVTGDGGTQAVGSVGAGACTHEGQGFHTYAPSQSETNFDHVAFTFTGSGAISTTIQIYTNHPQTGDAFARLGAPAGASVSADIAAVQSDADDIQTRLPAALVSGRMDVSVGAMAADVITSSALAASAVTEIQTGLSTLGAGDVATAVWDAATASFGSAGSYGALVETNLDAAVSSRSTLTAAQVNAEADAALADVGLTTTVTGRIDAAVSSRLATSGYTAPLDAAGVRGAVGLSSANLDTQLAAIDDFIDTEVGAIKTVTDKLDTAMELDGSVYRFTTNALEQGPSGGSGTADWTADERTAIRAVLGIPTSGTTPTDPSSGILDSIRDGVVAVQAKTDNLPSDPADQSLVEAAISAIPAAPSASSVAGAVRSELSTELGRIDATVSSRLAASSYSAPLDAAGTRSAVGLASANLDTQLSTIAGYIDTEVASVLSAVDTEVAAIKAKTDNLPASPAAVGDIPTAAAVADAVWDEALSGHLTSGSTGASLNAAGSAGDPWATTLPGAYGSGTAGHIIGNQLDAAVSSRASQSSVNTIDDFVDTEVGAIKAVTDKLDSALEADGGVYRFTTNALEQAPGGGSGVTDWTADERTAIRTILGVPTSGTTPEVPSAGALKVIDDLIDTEVSAILAAVDTEVADIRTVTNKLDTALELDGAVYRFTTNALEQAPSGSGGTSDWTADERTVIRAVLGIPGSGTTPADPTTGILDTIRDNVVAVKANTDNLPSDPADQSLVEAAIAAIPAAPSAAAVASAVRTNLTTELGRIDVAVSSRNATAPDNAGIAAIKAKTDNLPSDPADASDVAASFSTVNSTLTTISGYIDTEIAAIKAKTDLIPASPAAVGDIPSAATVASAVWGASLPGSYSAGQAGYVVGTNLDQSVGSRQATLDATARNAIADALLARDLGSGSNAGTAQERTVRSALRFVRNKWSISGGTLTVTREDDATTAWTAPVTTNASAEPITGIDPT